MSNENKREKITRDIQVSFSIDRELLELIDELAWKGRVSRSEYIYMLLDQNRKGFSRLNKMMGYFVKGKEEEKDSKTLDIFDDSEVGKTPV